MFLLILESEEGGDRDMDVRKKHWLPPVCIPARDSTHNLFYVRDDAPTNWPSWPGLLFYTNVAYYLHWRTQFQLYFNYFELCGYV